MKRTCQLIVTILFSLLAPEAAAANPTREAIIAYNDDCKAKGVRADFIAKFGGDFAGLDLSGVDFSGPHAVGLESNLREANFRGANLRGANFGAAQLQRASFRDADLRDARFITANLERAKLIGAQLAGASIRESNLGHVNAHHVIFSGADISGSDFPYANLAQAIFVGVTSEYWHQNFQYAQLAGADLSHVQLRSANFANANLRGADLSWAELEEADFTGAHLQDAALDYADVTHANFRHALGLRDERRRELMATTGRARWDRERHVKAFLDSPWFPLALVALIPGCAWIFRLARRRRVDSVYKSPTTNTVSPRFQFSLWGLLGVTLAVAVFVGVAMWSVTGLFSLAMVSAGYLMLDPVIYDAARRCSALRLVTASSIYTVGTIAILPLLTSTSPGFVVLWLAFGILIGPTAMIAACLCWATHAVRFSGLAATGFVLWMIGLALANLYLLGELMAAV